MPSREPDAVFGGLGPRLVRIWYLKAATQTWMFYDPDLEGEGLNTLTGVSPGDIVVIIVGDGAPIEFQGVTLYPGINIVALSIERR